MISDERIAELEAPLSHNLSDSACFNAHPDTAWVVGQRCYRCYPHVDLLRAAISELLAELKTTRAIIAIITTLDGMLTTDDHQRVLEMQGQLRDALRAYGAPA